MVVDCWGLSPRVRGNLAVVSAGCEVTGLSPRVRGNLAERVLSPDRHGSIPARAGEPQRSQSFRTGRLVYPRACGGTHSLLLLCSFRPGLSPRVRGNLPIVSDNAARHGSIPARAGEPAA